MIRGEGSRKITGKQEGRGPEPVHVVASPEPGCLVEEFESLVGL
jgi:hypothetical protein